MFRSTRFGVFHATLMVGILTACCQPLSAALLTYSYEDDFETNKAMTQSHSRSVLLLTDEPLTESPGYLHYESSASRRLRFVTGLWSPKIPFLVFQAAPEGADVVSGTISFDINRPWWYYNPPFAATDFRLLAYDDAGHSQLLGSFSATTSAWQSIDIQIAPDTPAQFIRFEGDAFIDNLSMSITYSVVPEPCGLLLLPVAGVMLGRRRAREGR